MNIRELAVSVPDWAPGLGMRLDGDGVVRGLLAKEQHGQGLGHILNKKRTRSHHIWQKLGYGNSPTSSADTRAVATLPEAQVRAERTRR